MMLDDTSTGRLMIAVLGGLADVERDLIRTAPPRAAAERKSAGSTWAGPAKLTDTQKAETRRRSAVTQPLPNSPAATT
jgi:DNA invertase Pin-like site-specific DNA recombinase